MELYYSSSGGGTSEPKEKSAVSPEPSCVSMKSDGSMIEPPRLSSGAEPSHTDSGGEEPSCVSMKSDRSMIEPPRLSSGGEEPSCVSMKSDRQHSTNEALHTQTLVEGSSHLQQNSYRPADDLLHGVIKIHKTSMKNKYESILEGIKTEILTVESKNKTLLNRVYTELYIIEGESEGVNEEHEVLQVEKTTRKHVQDIPINYLDIFKPLQEKENKKSEKRENKGPKMPKLRAVLTKGIAGIGKTVSVQKFILDWAEGKANQDVDFMFVLQFRELSLIKDDQYSLHALLCDFHPELKDLDPKIYDQLKAVFIFDGLDESRISLNFEQCEKVTDITMISSVGVVMTNLIKGELLPSALIWITSRPAAANQIPPQYINRVTEIQGFSDPQKEEYFRKRISDEDQANKIISHIKTVRSLHIMCHIPVFCWISATVLQRIMKQSNTEIPRTLTEMYSHFLITQTNMKNEKYGDKKVENETDTKNLLESNRVMLLNLAELAFRQLMKGNMIFYEEDLRESSIDITESSVYSGIFTEIFREESVIYQKTLYCFVHLSFQEFLAAVYVFHCYESNKKKTLDYFKPQHEAWSENIPLDCLLHGAVDKAVESKNGHLDLFLRFLLGISVESNQRLLHGLLTQAQSHSEKTIQCAKKLFKGDKLTQAHSRSEKTIEYIKKLIKGDVAGKHYISIERSINLFLCLSEMKDQSLSREIHKFLKSKKQLKEKLSPGQCSALACMLLTSEKVLDELDLKKCNTSEEGYRRLIPAVTACRKAILAGCYLTKDSCETLCSALQSANSNLKELDLSNNDLQDSGVGLLSAGLRNPYCKLEIISLSGCMVTDEGCSSLALALKSNPSHLRELDLTYNYPGESGVKLLSDLLENPCCKLEKLQVEFGGKNRIKPGIKKYACDLTLDPNTAHPHLSLSEGNRKVKWVRENQSYPDHPDRFKHWYQVLSVESLTGHCYWEAEWRERWGVDIAVSYRGTNRREDRDESRFGFNAQSWSLQHFNDSYSIYHNKQKVASRSQQPHCSRVGVFVDQPAGTLSFYNISPNTHTLTHLHTFTTTFTEPLYAGFKVYYDTSVQIEYVR